MAAPNLAPYLLGLNAHKLSRVENLVLEAELFRRVYEELKEYFKANYKNYFKLIKINAEMEEHMLESNFIRFLITDILSTENYSVEGIACYTQSTEDVICDVMAGENVAPSLLLSRRIMDLHRSVRPELYKEMMKKILRDYLPENPELKN